MAAETSTGYDLRTAAGLAIDSIFAHKLRSFLTLLGVMIGVASVILVGAAIDGVGVFARDTTQKAFGSETFVVGQLVQVGAFSRTAVFAKLKRNHQFKVDDMRYLQSVNSGSAMYSGYRQGTTDIRRNNLTAEAASVQGASASISEIRDINVVDGRFFTEAEDSAGSNVAVIGDDVRTTLFPGGVSPIGKAVKIQDIDFTVVGVQERQGTSVGPSLDNNAYIPLTAFIRLYGQGQSMMIFGRARPGTGLTLDGAVDTTRVAMRSRLHQTPGDADRFDFLTPDAIRGFIDQMLGLIAVVVVPLTLISLVVGGIVIMNIMLVSVTERTREIGIRKALGARQSDIMRQILIEALLMAVAGGAAGVAIGFLATLGLTAAFGTKLSISPFYVGLSVFVSGAVGVISGWYPASKAAKLDPIVALRSE